jgi:putative salt-induced outer membrane protein YdiY
VKRHLLKLILIAVSATLFQSSTSAQTLITQDTAATNSLPATQPPPTTTSPPVEVTPPTTTVTPGLTNQVMEPPVLTNQIPVIKPKPGPKQGSAQMLSAFSESLGGRYNVSGRTLKFPSPQPTTRDPACWQRSVDFGMNQTKGNSDTLRYALGVDAVKEENANKTRLRAHGAYGESDGTKDTENAAAKIRYDRKLTTRYYALGTVDWMTDPIAELDYRITGILSPGIHLYRSTTALFDLEIGAGYVEEQKDKIENGYTAGRTAITLEKLFNEHVLTWATAEYIPKLADPSIFFVNAEVGLASYITRNLSLNICYQNRYDSNPVEDIKASDTILSTALSLSF